MQEEREVEITISDILVSFLRNIKQIIIFALICALILGCWQGFIEYKNLSDTTASEAIEEYYRQLRDLEKTIERSNTGLENERKYISESLYMGLNPYGCYLCRIDLSFDDIVVPDEMRFGQDVNPTDYIAEKIRSQYKSLWDAFDLGKELGISKYASVDDRYVRELVTMNSTANGLTITAYEASESDARALAKAALGLIEGVKKDVAAVSYSHKLVETAINTKLQISETMRLDQETHYDNIDTYVDNISEAEESIKKLDEPDTPFRAVLKKVLIGGAVGFVLAAVYFMARSLLKDILQSPGQLTEYSNLVCLGCYHKIGSNMFDRLIASLSGEKTYASGEDSLLYISEMAKSFSDDERLFVSSTLDIPKDDTSVQSVVSALRAKGINVEYGPSVNTDHESLEHLKESDALLLIESCGKTLIKNADEAKSLAEKLGKKAIGFVLI